MTAFFSPWSRIRRIGSRSFFGSVLAASVLAGDTLDRGSSERTLWIDDSHDDFNRGHLSASGRNLYITHAGSLKQVFRYDLNRDGWADLLFNSAHDFVLAPPVTLVDLARGGPGPAGELPGIGARILKAGDFDADGRTDLLTIEESRWVNSRNYLHVYWGTESGKWDQAAQTDLLAEGAVDVEVLDWDADGKKDIVVLLRVDDVGAGGNPRRVLRAYWGGQGGFLQGSFTDLAAVDFDEIECLGEAGSLLALAGNGMHLKRLSLEKRDKLVAVDYRLSAGRIGNLRVSQSEDGPLILASAQPGGDSQADPTTAKSSTIWSRLVRLELGDDGTAKSTPSRPVAHTAYFWSAQRPDVLLVADVSKAENSATVLTAFDAKAMQFGARHDLREASYVSGVALARTGDSLMMVLARFRDEETYNTSSSIIPLESVLQGAVPAESGETVAT